MLTEQLETTTQTPNQPPSEAPPGGTVAGDMKELLRCYVADAKRKREIEAEEKAIKTRMASAEEILLIHFQEGGVSKTTVDGFTVYIHTDVYPKFRCNEEGIPFTRFDVMEALRKCGLSDYISENYNTQSFAAYVREMQEQGGLPPELDAVVEVSQKFAVRARAGK